METNLEMLRHCFPRSWQLVESESIPVTLDGLERPPSEELNEDESSPRSSENPTKKASLPVSGNEALERPRRDLNPQPPDRQSGALTN